MACAPGPDATRVDRSPSSAGAGQDDSRTLIIASRVEPKTLAGAGLNPTWVGISPDAGWQIFHGGLTRLDEKGAPHAQFAEALPQLGTDTWKVFPDSRMETTWRLRPNLSWHDGTPLSAEDFVLSFHFTRTARPEHVQAIDEVIALDARTLVLRYKNPAPDAGELIFQPLPRHIMAQPLEQMDALEAFATLPYWTTEFVGAGPYRLERWEPGAFITGVAFDGYSLGKPKIGRVQLVWISDPNTAMANLLSETIHFATDLSITYEQASLLRREWAGGGSRQPGGILLSTSKTVYTQIQFRPEYIRPPILQDVRLRQALAHSLDKQAVADAVLDGEPAVADTLVAKEEEYYAELDRAMTKYPLDHRRTDQLLTELGFTKDGEGFYGQGGNRLSVNLIPLGDYLREALVMADGWKRAGIDVPVRTLSAAEQVDQEVASVYPALIITQFQIASNPFPPFISANIPTAAVRWAGRNKGGYYDPEIDRLSDVFLTSLERADRNRAVMDGMRLLNDQAAYFPLYYGYDATARTGNLNGPRGGRKITALWNLEAWHWQ